jgi:lysyl-tRNA synthetase class 2
MPDEIIRNRYQKADELRKEGINPFANRYTPDKKSSDILANADALISSGEPVRVAGRVLAIRILGKAAFFHLQDAIGKIQIYVKKGMISEEAYRLFKQYIDTGDIVGIQGTVFRTKTGEVTVAARHLELLTKAMRPLPEKWHGLRDQEKRYRQRYVDLIVNENVRQTFELRSRIIASLRRYLDAQGYIEVETPMMQPVYGGALARPFTTYHNALDMPLFLRIAPELYLKRLVVGGFEKVYEINRNFRNEGISTQHNPEFTMLELYTAYWDYTDMMRFLQAMIKALCQDVLGRLQFEYQGERIDLEARWEQVTVLKAIERTTGLRLNWSDSTKEVRNAIGNRIEMGEGLSAAECIMALFEQEVEPQLVQPVFIIEFPKALSPLAKSKPDDPLVAERFELFIGRLEVANAYSELNDPREQYERFQEQAELRKAGKMEAFMMDEDYIRALEYGMPPTCGLGVGIDRLVMLLANCASIRDSILFPLMRPESSPSPHTEQDETDE